MYSEEQRVGCHWASIMGIRELAFILKVMYALYIHMSVYMYGFTRLPFISIDTYLYNHLYTLIYAFIYTYQLNR